jgi:hypothetical protein
MSNFAQTATAKKRCVHTCCVHKRKKDAKTFKSAPWRAPMPRQVREAEQRLTEDEIARRTLGPRGVPGGQDTAKMTPQQAKNIPKTGEFDGHTA